MRKFPEYKDQVTTLVAQHRELNDHPLVLALYYDVPSRPQDVFVLEVVHNIGALESTYSKNFDELVSLVSSTTKDPGLESPYIDIDEADYFDATYYPTPGFPIDGNGLLHVLLVNPVEFMVARPWDWPAYEQLYDAVKNDKCIVIEKEASLGAELLGWLRDELQTVA